MITCSYPNKPETYLVYALYTYDDNELGYAFISSYMYAQRYYFNKDGTFKRYEGRENSTLGCLNKSLQEIADSGRAFSIVTSKTKIASATGSVLPNFPDVIAC